MAVPISQQNPNMAPATGTGIGGLGGTYFAGTTQNVLTAGQWPAQKPYFASQRIYTINGDVNFFTYFTQQLGDQQGHNDTIFWYDRIPYPEVDACGSINAQSTTMVAGNGAKFTINDVFLHYASGTEILVTGVVGNVVSFTWVWPTAGPAAPIGPGALWVRIGNAHMQYDRPTTKPTVLEVEHSNAFQDFRHWTAASDQYIAGQFQLTPAGFDQQLADQSYDSDIEFEKALILGRTAALWNTGSSPRGFMRGIRYFQASNRLNLAGAVPTYMQFCTWADGFMSQNQMPGQNWWLVCGSVLRRAISSWGVGGTNPITKSGDTQYGIAYDTITMGSGREIKLKTHNLFDTHTPLQRLGLLVNMNAENIKVVYHDACPGKRLIQSIVSFGGSGQEKGYRRIASLMFKDEAHNLGVIDNAAAPLV